MSTGRAPDRPYPVVQLRSWRQLLAASGRMYALHWALFVGIGLVYLPVLLGAASVRLLLGEVAGLCTLPWLMIYFWVQAAVASVLADLGRGRVVSLVSAYRHAGRRLVGLARPARHRRHRPVRRARWRGVLFAGLVMLTGAVSGPLIGGALVLLGPVSLGFAELLAPAVYAVSMPYVALVLAYQYVDLTVRGREQTSARSR